VSPASPPAISVPFGLNATDTTRWLSGAPLTSSRPANGTAWVASTALRTCGDAGSRWSASARNFIAVSGCRSDEACWAAVTNWAASAICWLDGPDGPELLTRLGVCPGRPEDPWASA
jgi:hypothetical protein